MSALDDRRNAVYRMVVNHLSPEQWREFTTVLQPYEREAGNVCQFCRHGDEHHGELVKLVALIDRARILFNRWLQDRHMVSGPLIDETNEELDREDEAIG